MVSLEFNYNMKQKTYTFENLDADQRYREIKDILANNICEVEFTKVNISST